MIVGTNTLGAVNKDDCTRFQRHSCRKEARGANPLSGLNPIRGIEKRALSLTSVAHERWAPSVTHIGRGLGFCNNASVTSNRSRGNPATAAPTACARVSATFRMEPDEVSHVVIGDNGIR